MLLAVLMAGVAFINLHAVVRLSALLGAVWLALLLVIPRLRPATTANRFLRQLANFTLSNRKYLGLWAAAWLGLHAFVAAGLYFGGPLDVLRSISERPIFILELASLFILLLLAATSSRWVQRRITGWRHLHAAIWAVPVMAVVSSYLAAKAFIGQPPLLFIATFLFAACIAAGAASVFIRHKQSGDWLRLAWLAAGAVLTIVVLKLE